MLNAESVGQHEQTVVAAQRPAVSTGESSSTETPFRRKRDNVEEPEGVRTSEEPWDAWFYGSRA